MSCGIVIFSLFWVLTFGRNYCLADLPAVESDGSFTNTDNISSSRNNDNIVQMALDVVMAHNAILANAFEVDKKKNIFNCAMSPKSGIQRIQLDSESNPFDVLCDLSTNDGGWTVILNRFDGSVDFHNRTGRDYKRGFGNMHAEYFLGLDKLFALTNSRKHEVLILLKDFENKTVTGGYPIFRIGDESNNFRVVDLGEESADSKPPGLLFEKGQIFYSSDRYGFKGRAGWQDSYQSGSQIFAPYQGGLCSYELGCMPGKTLKMLIRPVNSFIKSLYPIDTFDISY